MLTVSTDPAADPRLCGSLRAAIPGQGSRESPEWFPHGKQAPRMEQPLRAEVHTPGVQGSQGVFYIRGLGDAVAPCPQA